jgi:tetratricopeptide (TPR) repeat protein
MRFLIVLRGYALLLVIVFFIGLAPVNLKPEEMTPKTAKEFLRRGERYTEQEEYEKALADFNQAEQLLPQSGKSIDGAEPSIRSHSEVPENQTETAGGRFEYQLCRWQDCRTKNAVGIVHKHLTDLRQ